MTWKMCFNPTKCEFLRVTNKKNIINFQYFIQSNNIQEVQQAKYLGVTINNKLSWSNHIKIISSKANSVVGFYVVTFNKNKKRTVSVFSETNPRVCSNSLGTLPPCRHLPAGSSAKESCQIYHELFDQYQSVTDMLYNLAWPTPS